MSPPESLEENSQEQMGRATCYQCFRPVPLCFCSELKRVKNRTRIVIVQHQREAFHPLNTARLAELTLTNIKVLRGTNRDLSSALEQLPIGARPALLYPSVDATDLESLPQEERPSDIFVIDGTWHQAKTLVRDLEKLHHFQKVRFTPDHPSEYQIRKEPQADYLSTIESIAYVLRRVEPDLTEVERLREAFLRMVNKNIEARKTAHLQGILERQRTRKRRQYHRFHPALEAAKEQLVIAYAERSGTSEKEPVLLLLSKGRQTKLWLIATEQPPEVALLKRLGLTEAEFQRRAQPLTSVTEEALEFIGQTANYLIAYHASTLRQLQLLKLNELQPFQLKGAYCDWLVFQEKHRGQRAPQQWGGLSEAISRHRLEGATALQALPSDEQICLYRAKKRQAETQVLYEWLRAQALENPMPEELKRSFRPLNPSL